MSGPSTYVPKSAIGRWFESRLPMMGLAHSSFVAYPTPRNLNYMWAFGAILSFMLVAQIVTGVVLAMHYVPSATEAFGSINHIMRDVNYGWLVRYMHTNGATLFFLACYIHMFRGIYYGSFKAPRELLWIIGVVIYFLMAATAFLGYVLPWGSMSFAGATVITNLLSAIPLVGTAITYWLWGGYAVGDPTLNRFFSLHYLLPFVIVGAVGLHVWALHVAGQNNPDGVEVKNAERDTVAFTPYATIKDVFALSVWLIVYAWLIFYIPNYVLDADNSNIANPLATPAHVVPEWYLLPFYAILRADSEQAHGRDCAVCIDRHSRVPAVARPFAGQVGQVPPHLSLLLLGVCRDLHWSRMARLPGADRGPDADRALSHCRIFRLLPCDHAVAQLHREDKADSGFDRGRRTSQEGGRRRGSPGVNGDRSQGKTLMIRFKSAALASAVLALSFGGFALAQEEVDQPKPPRQEWSFAGMFGTYDQAQLQRGFQVYREVCSNCHALSIPFRALADPDGPGYSEDQVKTLAASYQVTNAEPNDKGEIFKRPGTPADLIPRPEAYPNDQAAAAVFGKAPPDMDLSPRLASTSGDSRGSSSTRCPGSSTRKWAPTTSTRSSTATPSLTIRSGISTTPATRLRCRSRSPTARSSTLTAPLRPSITIPRT